MWSLLAKGAARNQRNKKGQTALALAARGGFKNTVDVLLQVEADVLSEDDEGWMPLHWAIIGSHNDIVRTLLNDAILKMSQEQLNKALIWASEAGNEEAVETLIARGADINWRDAEGGTPMD
jgi:ankyrin repeat protein